MDFFFLSPDCRLPPDVNASAPIALHRRGRVNREPGLMQIEIGSMGIRINNGQPPFARKYPVNVPQGTCLVEVD
jgi:hypothetical protein